MTVFRALPLLLLAGLLLVACQTDTPRDISTDALYDTYGASDATPEGAMPVQAVVAERAQYVDQPVKLEGMATSVCQRMGCWLMLEAGEGQHVRVHVDRDAEGDYRFTLPEAVVGQRVIVQGHLFEHELSADEQAHYAEDAEAEGALEATPDTTSEAAPRPELRVTATAVLVEKATT
ncbi:MAG: DUF4920 domain-containing protein [Bacteroidetes bacterium]|jgi:hypothetical protein|nr:DUF4920 domain-containing protein [Bacteroidota bacterium]